MSDSIKDDRRKQGIILRIPGIGAEIEIRGLSVIMTALLVVCVFIAGLLFVHTRDAEASNSQMIDEQKKTAEVIAEIGYINLLNPEQRKILLSRMQMPESLAKKCRGCNL